MTPDDAIQRISGIERAERERLDALPREAIKCRGHYHMSNGGEELAIEGNRYTSLSDALAAWDARYEAESDVLWLCTELRRLLVVPGEAK